MERVLIAVSVVCVGFLLSFGSAAKEQDDAAGSDAETASPSIDHLMGGTGRAEQAQRLNGLVLDGKAYAWEQYAAWGRELFHAGQVKNPPVGPKPSPQISQYSGYTCSRCHNDQREDPILTKQDPESRFLWINAAPERNLRMTQGVTLWGVVNRVSFYNGHFSIYHNLCVPREAHPEPENLDCGPTEGRCADGCRPMNTRRIEDAIQVCARYCCVGQGYLTDWELNALLTYLWDLELHLSDLDLATEIAPLLKKVLQDPSSYSPAEVAKYRSLLTGQYLAKSGETFRGIPEFKDGRWLQPTIGPYRQGKSFVGDPVTGGKLYELTCANCHGADKIGGPGHKRLVRYLPSFYEAVAEGTYRGDRPYMPEFTLERLSHQQIADILSYLQSLSQ